jgi:ornithine carbamoyltransferase
LQAKSLISVADLTPAEMDSIIKYAVRTKNSPQPQVLAGKNLALIFEKPSLRTRVSFEVAINQLGGCPLYLSPDEVGLGRREPVEDVATVLGRYVDCIIARTFAHVSLEALARYSGVPVINALSDFEHPCQALADMLTIYEKKGRLKGLCLAYVGDGNNVAHSLLLAAANAGMHVRLASPAGYEVSPQIMQKAKEIAAISGSRISTTAEPQEGVQDCDVIYTDVWVSMGQESEAEARRSIFRKYQVGGDLLARAKSDVIFMHPLPAHHGEEVATGILRLPSSVVFDQAENRLYAQRALFVEMFRGAPG